MSTIRQLERDRRGLHRYIVLMDDGTGRNNGHLYGTYKTQAAANRSAVDAESQFSWCRGRGSGKYRRATFTIRPESCPSRGHRQSMRCPTPSKQSRQECPTPTATVNQDDSREARLQRLTAGGSPLSKGTSLEVWPVTVHKAVPQYDRHMTVTEGKNA